LTKPDHICTESVIMEQGKRRQHYRKSDVLAVVVEIEALHERFGRATIVECLSGEGANQGAKVFIGPDTRKKLMGDPHGNWLPSDQVALTVKPTDGPHQSETPWTAIDADLKHEKCQRVQRPTVGQAADSLIANSRPIFSERIKKIVDEAVEAGLTMDEIRGNQIVKETLAEIESALRSGADDRIVTANQAFKRLKHRLNELVALRRSAGMDATDADRIHALLEGPADEVAAV